MRWFPWWPTSPKRLFVGDLQREIEDGRREIEANKRDIAETKPLVD